MILEFYGEFDVGRLQEEIRAAKVGAEPLGVSAKGGSVCVLFDDDAQIDERKLQRCVDNHSVDPPDPNAIVELASQVRRRLSIGTAFLIFLVALCVYDIAATVLGLSSTVSTSVVAWATSVPFTVFTAGILVGRFLRQR